MAALKPVRQNRPMETCVALFEKKNHEYSSVPPILFSGMHDQVIELVHTNESWNRISSFEIRL